MLHTGVPMAPASGGAAGGAASLPHPGAAAATATVAAATGGGGGKEDAVVWYYIDPHGQQQGPCSISQFRSWLKYLAENPDMRSEYDKFRVCTVWQAGDAGRRMTLMELFAHLSLQLL
ncbi:hypothetical protein GPECTOR_576g627 [Gonium pectorale]|uniref:GYF domain-containing protein n=1 Tax=Gonium pectorale TaxID=33097 RepID=A0A150FUM0_GONPE|nr:hypothetical protein GPECTOR_576g627 [Gonium pectorale]|eukprot:KXZ41289.1 hypothetical protein GPECTOR_576g627 [Gonium pectorale]